MESSESPLDVLSRAATMVQDNILPPSYDEARSYAKCKAVPVTTVSGGGGGGGKWRRERRPRPGAVTGAGAGTLPDYPHKGHSEPLDMCTRRPRGAPPSYSQSVCQRRPRPSVITACDPVIDEHFRRSLGKDYMSVFSANSVAPPAPDQSQVSASSLSVDDHFAKALGETWLKLQKGETVREGSVVTI